MKRALHLFMALALLGGCAVSKNITDAEKFASDAMQDRVGYKGGLAGFNVLKGSYIDGHVSSLESGHAYMKGKTITIRENGAYLADLGDMIASSTGVRVRYSPDLAKRRDITNTTMNVRYSGPLAELMSKIASYYNISWEYKPKENTVIFYYLKSKVYSIPTHLTNLEIESEISNKSDSKDASTTNATGSSTGENEQTVSTDIKFKPWDEFLANVKSMITKDGSVVVSMAAGTITVTESPLVLSRIDQFMESVSNKMARQVSVNVKVYNFRSQDDLNLGVSLNGIFNDGKSKINFGNVLANPVTTVGQFSAAIVTGSDSKWSGSNAIVEAMKEKGRVSLATTASGITQNNQPMPIQALRRTTYLASSSTTLNGDNSETSLTPGQIVSGMSIMITPHIQPNDIVNVEYNMSYSVIDEIDRVEAGNSMIQTPIVSSRSIMQRFQVRTGSTIIIAGYASKLERDTSGLGILQGLLGQATDHEYIVIIIDVADATLPPYSSPRLTTMQNFIMPAAA